MSTRSLRLQVLLVVSLSVAGVIAACDNTFPNALSVYDGDASFEDTGAPSEGDGALPDASEAGSTADGGGDAAHATDGGDGGHETDGSVDGSSPDGESDANFDAE